MSDSIATALGRLIQTELEHRFYWITRDGLTERREKILSLMQRRFGAGFSRELIRKVAAIQFDQLLASTDDRHPLTQLLRRRGTAPRPSVF